MTDQPALRNRASTIPTSDSPPWLRVVMVLLGGPNVAAGLWAIIAPMNWFDTFPGWAPHLVAAIPPFNHHLATDAGAGLLASGIVMLLGAIWPKREVAITAAIAYLAFVLPHFLYHLLNPADLMTGPQNTVNDITLAASGVGGAVVLFWHFRRVAATDSS